MTLTTVGVHLLKGHPLTQKLLTMACVKDSIELSLLMHTLLMVFWCDFDAISSWFELLLSSQWATLLK